jgi:hypothetical protein
MSFTSSTPTNVSESSSQSHTGLMPGQKSEDSTVRAEFQFVQRVSGIDIHFVDTIFIYPDATLQLPVAVMASIV